MNTVLRMSNITEISRMPLLPRVHTMGVKPPRVARHLDQAQGWLTEMAALYREARRGLLPESSACRLAYIASQGARLAKDLEELKAAETIRAQLERLGQAAPVDVVTITPDRCDAMEEPL